MKRFDFKLSKVRAWTDTRRQIEEANLESLLAELRQLDEDLAKTIEQCEQFGRELYQRERLDSLSLVAFNDFRQFVAREKTRVDRARTELNQKIDVQRDLLTEVKRKIALFDKLKDRQHIVWQAEADRELQQLADESVASRMAREMGSR